VATTPTGDSSKSSTDGRGGESLIDAQLVQEALKIAKNPAIAELMILELMEKYSFSFLRLKELLRGKPNG